MNPSWAELAQFIRFLYVQLNDCQSSIYCNQEFFGKGTDFKTFVVEFMIRMSQVCIYVCVISSSIIFCISLIKTNACIYTLISRQKLI